MCRKVGRPKKWTVKRIKEEGEALLEWIKKDDNFWVKSFAHLRGYSAEMFSIWSKDKENAEFIQAHKMAREMQEAKLCCHAVQGRAPAGAIFVLKAVHGYQDKQTIDHNVTQPVKIVLPPKPNE